MERREEKVGRTEEEPREDKERYGQRVFSEEQVHKSGRKREGLGVTETTDYREVKNKFAVVNGERTRPYTRLH